jgi:hypothetical protein
MVNSISDVTAVAGTRAAGCSLADFCTAERRTAERRTAERRLATGAFEAGRVGAAHQRPSSALMFARPRAIRGGGVSGHGRLAVVSGLPQGQPPIRKPYLNQARSAAFGDALGSHPPRDPV